MRICLVSREFVPFWGAGIGTYASQMAAAWQQAGHETHVLCPPHPGVAEQGPALRPGVRFHTVDTKKGAAALEAYRFAFMQHAMAVYESLLDLHARHPFDYIEFPEYWGEGYFALRGRRVLGRFEGAVLGVRLHTPTHECRRLNREMWLSDQIAWLEHAEDESLRLADVLVSPTRSLLEIVRDRLGLKNTPAHVVPYPFDVAAALDELGVHTERQSKPAESEAEVLYFGRIEHRKGVHLLVRAAQHLLESGVMARFRFVGRDTPSGPSGHSMLGYVQRLVQKKWRDRIHFEGARPRRELGTLIRQSTVCCFPSLWENFPNACLEAMALGAVVVGSDAGGMSEIIEDGRSGLLFRSGDAEQLADVIRRALTDEHLRRAVSAAAPGRIASLCEPARIAGMMCDVIEHARTVRAAPITVEPREARRAPEGHPLVSIIIPHYNLARYLPEAIASARAQTHGDREIIIVDDGSTDAESIALISRLEREATDGLRIVRKDNGGLSSARNAGVAEARGRWIVPLDADDLLDPSFIERALEVAARDPGLTMVTSLVRHFHETWDDLIAGWMPLGFDHDILAYRNCASCCTALIDRQAILDVGGYDTWLTSFEDWDLYCRFAARGLRMAIIPEFLIGYRTRADSMLRTEGRINQAKIKAYLFARHASLSRHPDRTLRLQLAATTPGDPEARARQIIAENIRYRMADRVNDALKLVRVQKQLKTITRMMLRREGR